MRPRYFCERIADMGECPDVDRRPAWISLTAEIGVLGTPRTPSARSRPLVDISHSVREWPTSDTGRDRPSPVHPPGRGWVGHRLWVCLYVDDTHRSLPAGRLARRATCASLCSSQASLTLFGATRLVGRPFTSLGRVRLTPVATRPARPARAAGCMARQCALPAPCRAREGAASARCVVVV